MPIFAQIRFFGLLQNYDEPAYTIYLDRSSRVSANGGTNVSRK